ncbi:MAG TPA: cell division protein FtsL [Myxococcaceae bacterium]|nr:cell division protein FtsL [Myxococcaceae bacterium]
MTMTRSTRLRSTGSHKTVSSRPSLSITALMRGIFPAVLFFAALAGLGILHVTGRVLVVDAGYRLSRLEAEGRELEREHQRLQLERATLTNPQRLEALARTQLSMSAPASGTILTVPAPAAGTIAAAPAVQAPRSAP